MDTRKLDKWADLLLDTGKRNNLINFKDTRVSTVEVLLPSSDALFAKVEGAASFEVYDPQIIEDDDNLEESSGSAQQSSDALETLNPPKNERDVFWARYAGKIKRQNQILLYNPTTSPITAVKNIHKKAREFIEETGVNVAYMAFGFIHWKESDSSGLVFRAPILLVPIQMEQASALEPYIIKSTEDDIIVNPTFSYKMEAEYGVKLPEYNDEGLNVYLETVRCMVSNCSGQLHRNVKSAFSLFSKSICTVI